ncbi:Non-ribosomal peptide synthetase/alpha-aminoadipate reductase and related enzymes [Ceraceosorus bombacis]|uniref:Non-ribosomal peptide synthetase/alpha-aminoadipate reductase and related enzymes n=1 Tax=Ceraceosorus bombacis TaxID=401625 RepID=A0A0N7LBG8_9BASI|nr:Non-ribosomal peptide synthetase/alpha-aminoadipate reductase and related enzymes [Ceraceosorus bombacis]
MPVPDVRYKPILVPSLLSVRARDDATTTFREDYRAASGEWHVTTYSAFEELVNSYVRVLIDAGLPLRTRNTTLCERDGSVSVPVVATLAGSTEAETAAYFAIIKMGCTVFPLSPRAPPDTIAALLQKHRGVTHLLFAPPFALLAGKVSEALQSSVVAVAGESIINVMALPTAAATAQSSADVEHLPAFMYDLDELLEQEYDRTILLLHTSGSSGLPKVAKYTHRSFMVQAGWYRDPAYASTQADLEGSRFFSGTPLFHAIGWIIGPILALTIGAISLAPAPGPPPPVSTLTHLLTSGRADRALIVPSQLDEMSIDAAATAALAKCKAIWYGGAPLGPQSQETLAKNGVKLCSAYGLTETGAVAGAHELAPESQRDAGGTWITLRSEFDYIFEPAPPTQATQSKELFELVVKSTGRVPLPFETSAGVCNTGDLCERHPDAPDSVIRLDGRIGDLVILSNGENVPTLPFESAACKHPSVHTAVIFGHGKPSAGLLIETTDASRWSEADLVELMKLVDSVNREQPAFATIFPSRILLASPSKPLPKTDKGTVKKKQALQLYADEVAQVYERDTGPLVGPGESDITLKTKGDVEKFVKKTLVGVLGVDVAELTESRDLFDLGLDSLRSSLIRGAVLRAVRDNVQGLANGRSTGIEQLERAIPASFAFDNATPQKLVHAVARLVEGDVATVTTSSLEQAHDTLSHFRRDLEARLKPFTELSERSQSKCTSMAALVTGTTGGLGCILLEQLLQDKQYATIICVNRATHASNAGGRERQSAAFEERAMDQTLAQSDKLTFVDGNIWDLTIQQFQDALQGHRLGLIVHNAWPVRFDLPLSSFEKSIAGLVSLLELAAIESAKLVFLSSVAAVKGTLTGNPAETVRIDESTQVPLEWALGGYGESKLIGEKLVCQAVRTVPGLHAVSVRCGQLMGDYRTGVWNADEWWPSIVRSATPEALGSLPSGPELGDVDWISMNDTAVGILSYASAPSAHGFTSANSTNVVHLINPKSAPASLIEKSFAPTLPAAKVLPYREWLKGLQALRPSASLKQDELISKLSDIPALKLSDTYEAMANADRHATLKVGEMEPFLANAVVLDKALATRFVARWLH